jgi:DNA-binding NarL/FixJ family response regulator
VKRKIVIGVAEDNVTMAQIVIERLLSESDFEVAFHAENGKELLRQLDKVKTDLVLMDMYMPVMDGLQATQQLRRSHPLVKVIAYSHLEEPASILAMHIAGARSFIGKQSSSAELFLSIRTVANGGIYMTEYAANIVREQLVKTSTINNIPELTSTEKLILRGIAKGMSSSEIGRQIFKSPRTVEDMRQKLYVKFNVQNKEQLVVVIAKLSLDL